MNIKDIPAVKTDDRGAIYDCGGYRAVIRKKGSISADHSHSDPETLYLLSGRITLTVDNETAVVEAPVVIEFKENSYHKIAADTDIILLYKRDFSIG